MIYYMTEGEYSDYSIIGIFEGPEGVDLQSLAREYMRENPSKAKEDRYAGKTEGWNLDSDGFHKFVLERAGLKEVSGEELHIGAYGRFVLHCEALKQ